MFRFALPRSIPWLAVLLLSSFTDAQAGRKEATVYDFAAVPAWVQVTQPQYDAGEAPDDVNNGAWYLMFERQIKVGTQGDDEYRHVAVKVLNASGVEGESQFDIGVDPSFQTLSLHALRVVRNGAVIDQRSRARITALPEESELENHIYNGAYNVDVVLSDVRVGDVIEYEYTVHSVEKLFPGHFATRIVVGWSSPMLWQHVRVLYPSSRPIQFSFKGTDTPAETRVLGDNTEQSFTWTRAKAIHGDADRPDWYRTWPYIEVSDYPDWQSVAQRMSALFVMPTRSRPKLEAATSKLREAGGTPEETVLRALQMVQEDVRYTSISIGRGSHVPTDPETILDRRFGDCKDKALLLSSMLQKLGIDATPALVHSTRGPMLADALPTPYGFDHAIARVRLGDAVYWLDATRPKQYSALSKLTPANFSYALPVTPATRALEAIPKPAPESGLRDVEATLDFSKGVLEPARFDVDTRYEGGAADTIRRTLARKSAALEQSEYLNYYARHYPRVSSNGALTVDDDQTANVLVTHEHYTIDQPFAKNDEGRSSFTTKADELYQFGRKVQSSVRTAPLAVEYPDHVKQGFTVKLPEEWKIDNESKTIENPAFRYHSSVLHTGNTVKLEYEYQALSDHVDTTALAKYQADREALDADLNYRFSFNVAKMAPAKPRSLAVAPLPFFVGLISLGFGIWLMRRYVYPLDPEPRLPLPGTESGLKSWLRLAAVSAIASPISLLIVFGEFATFFEAGRWDALPNTVLEAYRGVAQGVALLLLAVTALLFPLSATSAIVFFRKRTLAPMLFSINIVATTIFNELFTHAVVLAGLDKTHSLNKLAFAPLIRIAIAALWCAYFLRSNRVKATFVNRRNKGPAMAGSANTGLAPAGIEPVLDSSRREPPPLPLSPE